MSNHTFYSTENHHNERQIRILSVGSLVSKPPTKEKRISVKVRMLLSGSVNMGAPAWLDEAYSYVASHGGDTITPDIEFKGYSIDLSVENLFGDDVKSADCIMRGFEISEFGDEETPDVVLNFTIRMPYSGKKWQWLGEFVGEDVWAKFIPGEVGTAFVETDDGTLLDDGENEEESIERSQEAADGFFGTEEGDAEEEPADPRLVSTPTKSGPKGLQAFHEAEVEKEGKRERAKRKAVEEF